MQNGRPLWNEAQPMKVSIVEDCFVDAIAEKTIPYSFSNLAQRALSPSHSLIKFIWRHPFK